MYLNPRIEEIRKRREKLGYSRYALSKKAGLGGSAIERIEKGLHTVHHLRAKAIAEVLGCSVEELFETNSEENFSKASSL